MSEMKAERLVLIAACLLLLACLVSQQWRRSRERLRMIQQLLRLALEESARAELEASAMAWIGPLEALILCTLPLVAFLIYRNCQQSVESHRIERLRDQAWRAETTSSMGHTMYSPPYYLCPVCCHAATLQCTGCMAIRYCSVECQSIHWHSGHSQQCRYPSQSEH